MTMIGHATSGALPAPGREWQAGSEERRVPRNKSAADDDLAVLAHRLLGAHPTPEDVIAAYDAALRATWAQLAVLIGDLGAHAVFDRALQIAQADVLSARAIVLGETAFDFHTLAAGTDIDGSSAPDLALDALCRGCGEVIISLIGAGLYATILRGATRQLSAPSSQTPRQPNGPRSGSDPLDETREQR